MTAYKSGLKGITVYREGSREGILITKNAKEEKKSEEPSKHLTEDVGKTPRSRPNQTKV